MGLSKKTLEAVIELQLQIKSHQRKTKTGHTVYVPAHQRKGEVGKRGPGKLDKAKPRQTVPMPESKEKPKGSLNQAQKKPATHPSLFKEIDNGQLPTTMEAAVLMAQYNKAMEALNDIVKGYGDIELARKDKSYKTLIAEQKKRLKRYGEIVNGNGQAKNT